MMDTRTARMRLYDGRSFEKPSITCLFISTRVAIVYVFFELARSIV